MWGFAVESKLNDLTKKDNVTSQIKLFMKGVEKFLCAMVTKLFEWSPFGSMVLLSAAMFDYNILLNAYLKDILKHLLELNILSTKQFDVITNEFKKFLDVEVKTMQRESVTLSQSVKWFLLQSC